MKIRIQITEADIAAIPEGASRRDIASRLVARAKQAVTFRGLMAATWKVLPEYQDGKLARAIVELNTIG